MTTYTGTQIEIKAERNGMDWKYNTPNSDGNEFLTVSIKSFITAFFLVNNQTGDLSYSHTYNAKTDKTTKRTPKQFV